MGRAFRWHGPGVLTDVVDGRARAYMGRRTDADGHVIEGDIVREHTVDPAKLDTWVKTGAAEYVNILENAADRIAGGTPAPEAELVAAAHQQAQATADAAARLTTLAELRRITMSPVFDDDDRKLAEMELQEVPVDRLRDFLESARAERDRRQGKGREERKEPPADDTRPDLTGAGSGGPGDEP